MSRENVSTCSDEEDNDSEVKAKRALLKTYEKFLITKGISIPEVRHDFQNRLNLMKKLKKKFNQQSVKQKQDEKIMSKDDYLKELRESYQGRELLVNMDANEFEEVEDVSFWDWNVCYIFKNPDAQKKENKIKKESAFKKIMKIFKPTPLVNEVQKIKLQEAHEQAIREILDQMADENGMVKMYRGGRFERIETVQEENTRKKKQAQQRKMIEKAMRKENGERAAEYLDKEEDNLLQAKWIDHGSQSRDLTTLVMNIFLRKLNVGLSLETAQLISLDGNSIYIVVKADFKDLKKIAEESQYSMQLAIGLTDLSSLEPCDKYLRPLRK